MECIKYPSIEQLRNVVYSVNKSYNFIGLDEQGEPKFDHTMEKPTLNFVGTVMLHGTNASVAYNDNDGFWVQSRKNIITPAKDNAGFAFFAEARKKAFMTIITNIQYEYDIDTQGSTIILYGEWAGQGIQKGVAISERDKSFYIFGAKAKYGDTSIWLNTSIQSNVENNIFNVEHFKTFDIDIDFNHPELSQNKIVEMTIGVEDECPISKELGVSGIGEGIVFTHQSEKYGHLMFKSKGEKHSKTRVKIVKKVDDERLNIILELAQKVTPDWRLEQFLNEACDLLNGGQISRAKLGDFIRMVISDVMKEDLDLLVEKGIEPKEMGKPISDICRKWFFKQEEI